MREVKSGDTGADIAGMFGVTLAELAGTNPGGCGVAMREGGWGWQ